MGFVNDDDAAAFARVADILARHAVERKRGLLVRELYEKYKGAFLRSPSWGVMERRLESILLTFGEREIDQIVLLEWSEYAAARRVTPIPGRIDGRCYSERTINAELDWFKSMLNWGVTEGRIRFNPIAAARHGKCRKRRDTAPQEWEIQKALDACETVQHTTMVLCAADAGMRRGEIVELRHEWVDHHGQTITLPDYACKNRGGGEIPATKRLLEAISACPRDIRCRHVLINPNTGGPYHWNTLDEWWKGIRERAGIESAPLDGAARLHDLRAACATNALDRGVRLETVSKRILRHSSLATTELYLRGREVGNLDQAIAAMEAGILRDQKRRGPRRSPPPDAVSEEKQEGDEKTVDAPEKLMQR